MISANQISKRVSKRATETYIQHATSRGIPEVISKHYHRSKDVQKCRISQNYAINGKLHNILSIYAIKQHLNEAAEYMT